MTDQIQDQDVELVENEIEEAHDPKNAEAQSIASVDKAEDAGKGKAPTRKGDNSNSESMPKTKGGMISAMYQKMNKMGKADLQASYGKMMGEEVEAAEDLAIAESPEVEFNYSNELDALVESEATLSEEFKDKTAVLFETALKTKLAEEIDRLETNYAEELVEETTSMKAELVEKVDSYLNYVVENWMEENEVAVQAGLRTEIAEGFMNKLKDLFVESYVEVPEAKVDLVDDLVDQVSELEESLNTATAANISLSENMEELMRGIIISEATADLTEVDAEKLQGLVESIDFDDATTFEEKVAIVKSAHFNPTKIESPIVEEVEMESGDEVQISESMAKYLTALRKTNK